MLRVVYFEDENAVSRAILEGHERIEGARGEGGYQATFCTREP
jgi:hypothetical protein